MRKNGQTARSTRLVMLNKNTYILWGQKSLLHYITNFLLKSLYPLQGYFLFSMKIVAHRFVGVRVGVTYSRGKLALCTKHRNPILYLWYFPRYPRSYLRFVGVGVGVAFFFRSIDRFWWEQYISVKMFILASKL